MGDSELGVIATAGFDNGWRTRENVEQTPASFDLFEIDKDFRSVATENHAVANALSEFQERGGNVVYYNRYDVGTTISASVTVSF